MALIFLYLVIDMYTTYYRYYNQSIDVITVQDGQTPLTMVIEYYFVSSTYLILTVLILAQTCSINKTISKMGNMLMEERSRLHVLMWTFSASYVGISTYYIV